MLERFVYDPLRNAGKTLLSAGKFILFNKEGRDFLEDPMLHMSKADYQLSNNLIRRMLGGELHTIKINPSQFDQKTLVDIVSGPSNPDARKLMFKGMVDMLALTSPYTWFTKQTIDTADYPYRNLLVKRLQPRFDKLDEIIKTKLKLEIKWMKENPVPDLRAWAYQFTIEILAEYVLGIKYMPDHAHKIFHATEDALIHFTEPTTLFGYRLHLTPEQKKFEDARENLEHFARDLVESNQDEIIQGPGYLNDILKDQAEKCGVILNENHGDNIKKLYSVFENEEVKSLLAQGAKVVLLNSGALHKVLTVAMIQFDSKTLENISQLDANKQKDFLRFYFYEAVRFGSPVSSTLRVASEEKTLTTKEGKDILIKPNTFMFFDFRESQHRGEQWQQPEIFNPERHQEDNTPKLNSTLFSPFLLGPRRCPGRMLAERIVKDVIETLASQGVYIDLDNPEIKNLLDERYWTLKGPVTEPQPGIQIGTCLMTKDLEASPSARLGL